MTPSLWRLVADLALSRIRGLPDRVLWGMGIAVEAIRVHRAKREAMR